MLTQAQQLDGERRLLGLSALPGCGKSSFGAWLEAASSSLGVSVQVVSIDDFYFTADDLDQAMHGNPWKVPRALPGSHDIPLLNSRLEAWKRGDQLNFPALTKHCARDVVIAAVGVRAMPKCLCWKVGLLVVYQRMNSLMWKIISTHP